MPPGRASGGSHIVDTALVFVVALVLYAVLRQEVFYHIDGRLHIHFASRGDLFISRHLLYIPVLWVLHQSWTPDSGWFDVASWMSVVGMALGVALLHRATALLHQSRGGCLLVAALVGTTPAVLFYASVVELHGPFMPAVGLAAVFLARLVRHPSLLWALALGGSIGLAYLLHATGLALLVMMPLMYVALAHAHANRATQLRELLWCTTIAAIPALFLSLGLPRYLVGDAGRSVDFLVGDASTLWTRFLNTPSVLWREWVVACIPVSVAWVLAIRLRDARPLSAALVLTLAVYAVFTGILLPGEQFERGAYLLPLLWPAALLTAAAARPALVIIAIALGAWLGWQQIEEHERPRAEAARAYAAGVQQARGEAEATLLIGESDELDHCITHLPTTNHWFLPELLVLPHSTPQQELAAANGVVTILRQAMQNGQVVILTEGGESALRDPKLGSGTFGQTLLQRLQESFEQEDVSKGPWKAVRLRPRA